MIVRVSTLATWVLFLGCTDGVPSPNSGEASDVPERLTLPDGVELQGEFSRIVGLRELSDGTVWVADGLESRLVRIRTDGAPLDSIDAHGDGPLEYRSLAGLFAVGGDTTLIYSIPHELLDFVDSEIVGGTGGALREFGPPLGILATDTIGGVLIGIAAQESGAGNRIVQYSTLYRTDRTVTVRDTVGRVERRQVIRTTGPDGRFSDMMAGDSYTEGATLAPDGWIAIARGGPYRVEWVSPEGESSSSGPLALPEDAPSPLRFGASRPVPTPDGSVIVALRTLGPPPDSIRYDVVHRDGTRPGYLVLPHEQRIVAAGRQSIYVVRTDDLGLQRVSRHAWRPGDPAGTTVR